MAGGALGNFLDRLVRGYVIDFIDWHWRNQPGMRWPTFNVADAAICVGVALMLLDSLRCAGRAVPPRRSPRAPIRDAAGAGGVSRPRAAQIPPPPRRRARRHRRSTSGRSTSSCASLTTRFDGRPPPVGERLRPMYWRAAAPGFDGLHFRSKRTWRSSESFFRLRYAENPGAAWGMFRNLPPERARARSSTW